MRRSASDGTVFANRTVTNPDPHADAVAVRGILAPLISSHSMNAISPKTAGWAKLNTLSSYCGHSSPVKLQLTHATPARTSQPPRSRGRNRDLYTSDPRGNSHSPQNIPATTNP